MGTKIVEGLIEMHCTSSRKKGTVIDARPRIQSVNNIIMSGYPFN